MILSLPTGRLYEYLSKYFKEKNIVLPNLDERKYFYKDVWRSGGSSKDVLDKWNLLYEMICK